MAMSKMGYSKKSKMPTKTGMYSGGSPYGFNVRSGTKTYGRRNPKQTKGSNDKMNKPRMTGY